MLKRLLAKRTRTILGINSGTSIDGIDLVLVRINPKSKPVVKIIAHSTIAYPDGLRPALLSAIQQGSAAHWSQLNMLLGQLYADAANDFIRTQSVKSIDAIGLHGQTVFHHPEPQEMFGRVIRSTWQIGDPDVVAKKTGIVTVSHFRNGDVAEGGSGAPLVPILDIALFRHARRRRILLNLGGMANLTLIERDSTMETTIAFDTGPGNVLIDHFAFLLRGQPYDPGGQLASKGSVLEVILQHMMHHPYLRQEPPKSTGRELFGSDYATTLEKLFKGARPEDVLRTVTEFTAVSIADQIRRFIPGAVDEIIASGGGTKNAFLMERLRYQCGVPVLTSDEFGVPAHTKEAVLFAYLADAALSGRPANVPSVTGARRPVILGRISQP